MSNVAAENAAELSRKARLAQWFNDRMPFDTFWRHHFTEYYAPKNFNIWYYFGSLALVVFVIQIISGIWLTMYYTPTAADAFDSVQYIMRDVNYGWLIRYMHTTGASAFFIVIYLHMFRALLYGSYKKPRELLWLVGVVLYLLLMAEAFMGYLLPWGQMSYWAAQVITSLFSAIPYVGESLLIGIRGDYTISDVTLHRFFALHVSLVPMALTIFVWLHIVALRHVGSNNPEGIEIRATRDSTGKPLDGIPFHPYYTYKDLFGMAIFLIIFASILFFAPEMRGFFIEHANFAQADPLNTPTYIAPVWYFTPFYAILRAIPNKLMGIMGMLAAIGIFVALPWLDRSPVRSIRYKGPWSSLALTIFAFSFLGLGYFGLVHVTPSRTFITRILSAAYFLFFLLMPFYTGFERTKSVPSRISS